LALGLGCGGEAPPPADQGAVEPTEPAPSAREKPSEPATGSKGEPEIKPEPATDPEPAASDVEISPPKDPLAVLMTLHNRWTYRVFHGFHDTDVEVYEVTREVTRVGKHGQYQLAVIRQHATAHGPEAETTDECLRIRKGDQTWWVDEYSYDAYPKGEKEVKRLIDSSGRLEVDLRRASKRLVCSFIGCAGGYHTDVEYDPWTGLWPGIGIVSDVDADYSPETGDGSTRHLLLTGFLLADAAPSLRAAPEGDAAPAREQIHGLAKARDVSGLAKVLPEDFMYSLHAEHQWRNGAVETWEKFPDDLASLAAATGSACTQLETTPALLACPAQVAERQAKLSGRREFTSKTTDPRAYFVQAKGKWKLAAYFQGGHGDVFVLDDNPEFSLPRPMKE
jgi:hypothetical protein